MWSGADNIALREIIIRITMATYGGYTEEYLLSLAPFEIEAIEHLILKINKTSEDS